MDDTFPRGIGDRETHQITTGGTDSVVMFTHFLRRDDVDTPDWDLEFLG